MHTIFLYSKVLLIRYIVLWELKNVALSEKISLTFLVPTSLVRTLVTKSKNIRYFGHKFQYDDFTLPVTLLTYPYEVTKHILSQVDPKHALKNILDIGGNVGQFSVTIAALTNAKKIDVFEPNSEIFNILEMNTQKYHQINLYNFGVGRPGTFSFFFRQNKSGTGSLIKKNSDKVVDADIKEVQIKLTSEVKKLTKNSSYDLIKIDVEGSEMEVLKNLEGITTKYLYIEISAQREKSYSTSEIYDLIRTKFGNFEVLYQDELHSDSVCFNTLVYFP